MGGYDNLLIDHILFLLLAVVLPGFSLKRGEIKLEEKWNTKIKTAFYFSNSAVLWAGAIIILVLWYICGRNFAMLGFQFPLLNTIVLLFTGLFIVIYAYQLYRDFFTEDGKANSIKKWRDKFNLMPVNYREFIPYSFLAFTAGVTEEIIFRAYLMNYILAFSPSHGYINVILAMLIPALIFGIIHIYQGIEAVQKIVIGGLFFGAIYYYSQSLILVMLIHFLIDFITGYLLMNVMNQDMLDSEEGS